MNRNTDHLGRILKLLNIVDEHSREELGGLVERRIDADRTAQALDDIVMKRGQAPAFIRCDNGPELTKKLALDARRENPRWVSAAGGDLYQGKNILASEVPEYSLTPTDAWRGARGDATKQTGVTAISSMEAPEKHKWIRGRGVQP